MIRVRLKITGRVQGVYFRAHAQERAREFGVTGWVANEGDGSVAVVAEGPENLIHQFTEWCHGGPSTAQVEKVEVITEPYSGEFAAFEIRY